MKDRGVNGVQLATETGLPKNAISEWSNGKAKPGTDAIIKIAKYFGVTTDYILIGTVEAPQGEIITSTKEKGNEEMKPGMEIIKKGLAEYFDAIAKKDPSLETQISKLKDKGLSRERFLTIHGNVPDESPSYTEFKVMCSILPRIPFNFTMSDGTRGRSVGNNALNETQYSNCFALMNEREMCYSSDTYSDSQVAIELNSDEARVMETYRMLDQDGKDVIKGELARQKMRMRTEFAEEITGIA